jgi:phosphoenolpyruvate synthase/pyruvate phosphate dikinase
MSAIRRQGAAVDGHQRLRRANTRHLRQGPSDHPDLARWLVDQGIESISLNPDTVVATWLYLAGKSA